MAKVNQSFFADMYLYLAKVVRDQDAFENFLLERYLGGPQLVFESFFDDLEQLATLHNVDTIADEWLPFLKWHLGWTAELDHVTKDLSPDELRKLLRASASLWKQKGTELGLKNALRIITGRDVMLWNWFRMRWVLDVARIWRLGSGTDPMLTGDEEGERDEYLTIIWVMNEVGVQKELIRSVVNLCRPLQEAVKIVYADFVDDLRLGRSKWITDTGSDVTWDNTRYVLTVPGGTRIIANVPVLDAAEEIVWRHRCAFTTASGGSVQMEFRRSDAPYDCYRATWNQDGTVALDRVDGGIPTSLGTADVGHPFPEGETTVIGITTSVPASGNLKISVVVYDDNVITVDEVAPDTIPVGQWSFQNVGPDDVEIDDIIAYEFPVDFDTIRSTGVEIVEY